MRPVILRPLVGLVLVAAVGLVPLASPEHVHEVEDHGHVQVVVHRHLQAHGIVAADTHHDGRDAARTVDHSDGPITTLDQHYVVRTVARLALPASSVPVTFAEAQPSHRIGFAGFINQLIHGPPRAPAGLRAPPARLS